MKPADLDVLRTAHEWTSGGHACVLATVIATWGSSPRPPGSMLVVRDDGRLAGSVSGGCIEDDLAEQMRAGRLAPTGPARLRYGATADEVARFNLPCGGSIELVVEPVSWRSCIGALIDRLAVGDAVRRTLDLRTGEVSLTDGDAQADAVAIDGERLVVQHGPQWQLLLIGAGQLSHYVAQLAVACDYKVVVCDPRSEFADAWSVPGTSLVRTMPDDTVLALRPGARTAIVALTHDPKLDDLALIEALKSPAFYVGALGSRRTQADRRERLREFGLEPAHLARLHGPVGVKNGARTPAEMAASIVTEMTARKYGYRIPPAEPLA